MRINNAVIRSIHLILAGYIIGLFAFTWANRLDPFFWDTVQLGSKHAHFFYENGLRWLPLPTDIDSGHPPVFGYFLAGVWMLFGKTLVVSHFAMFPFLLLSCISLWRIGFRLAGSNWGGWLPLLVFSDPVLLGQSALIGPDIVLVTSFLLALDGILGKHKWLIVLGVLGLCTVSMRGMMSAAALMAWSVGLPQFKAFHFRKMLASGLPFIPGFAFAAWFLWWHWSSCGWLGYHPDSPWASAFKTVGFTGFIKNIVVVGWRWVDLGRVGELIVLAGAYYWVIPRKEINDRPFSLLLFLLCPLFFLCPSALLYQNLSAHRYFLPAFIACHLLVFQVITTIRIQTVIGVFRANTAKYLLAALVVLLATGNLWIYPRGIAMDWDSTLAHWPYHKLRQEAMQFMEKEKIAFSSVGTAFPNINTGENLYLNGDQRQFAEKDFALNQYMMASNVFNDFSEADYRVLQKNWRLVWQKKKRGVWIEIYKRY